MIPPLYQHQKDIIKDDPKMCGLWLGTGGAKTRTALELAEGSILVICPKQQVLDNTWHNNAHKFGIYKMMRVISKEEFRRDWEQLNAYDTVIIDEVHNNLGVLPDTRTRKGVVIPKTSQLFEATQKYLERHPPKRLYLCSATPASKPMNVWAIARLFGKKWDFFKFRERFYVNIKMGYRSIWLPKTTSAFKEELAGYVKKMGYTGRLQDWFDVPEQSHIIKYVDLSKEQKDAIREINSQEADPMVKRTKMRSIENGVLYEYELDRVSARTERMVKSTKTFKNEKIDYILERALEFPKMLIFANYTAQVEAIQKALEKEKYTVYTLTGQTKDRGNVVSSAEKATSCIVIAQCGISAGYELKSVPCVIFASKSYKYLDYEQGCGRVLRADALKKNLYIHLVVKGGVDEACHKAIEAGEDFQEKIHEQ